MRCILDVPRSFGIYAYYPKLVAPHVTFYASCPKLKSKTNLWKKLVNKTKQGMRQMDNTYTYSLLKNTQKTRNMKKKNNKRKRVKK
jgi:hypothetical protein